MSSIHTVLPVLVLVDTNGKGSAGKIVFSPGKPRSAVVLFEDAPPEVHDFGNAELTGSKMQGYSVLLGPHTLATKPGGKPLSFRGRAACAAFRPGKDELALVFAAEDDSPDCTVWRINPVNGADLPSVYFDNPSSIVYSSDGELFAVGGQNGDVTVFRLMENGEAKEVRTVGVGGAVRSMVFEELENQLYVATDRNMLVSVFYEVEDDLPVQRGIINDECSITNRSLKTLAYHPNSNLLAAGGIGKEVWVSNPARQSGRSIALRQATRILGLQFAEKEDCLVVIGDHGVELVSFSIDSEHLPVFEQRTVTFTSIVNLMGCHHYGELLFIGTLLSFPLD
ncbi:MAG: hypothetical protein IT343_22995 [Candidatus Melainabacteria bacterium]|jgi:hypothetical protein|nr:hypothetical protein [Candidatus Melainabacteria bacterium]